jgi:segregation and condensation protein B
MGALQAEYATRGVNLVRVAGKWSFRTAKDLAWLMAREAIEQKKLSRAATETLAIIAYHQPVTRAEIEDIRGVSASKGTLDVLLETGWIRPRGRRKTPGRPLTFGTTEAFLSQFSLEALGDLPGLDELKGAGLLDTRLPGGFNVPSPSDDPALRDDEEPLEPGDLELALAPAVEPEKGGES